MWDVNSINSLMVGCSDRNKGYRIYDPAAKKIMIWRDVIFRENKEPQTIVENVVPGIIQSQPRKDEQSLIIIEEETKTVEEDEQTPTKYKIPRLPIPPR